MIYDGYDFSRVLKVEYVHRPLMPGVSTESQGSSGTGESFGGASLDPETIDVDVRLIAGFRDPDGRKIGFERLRESVAGKLWKGKLCKLVLDDAPHLWNWAVVQGNTDLERFLHTGGTTITWYFPDPVWHGVERRLSSAGGTVWCNVVGNHATAPVVEVETQGSAATVLFDGATFRAEGNVSSADPLTIDAVEKDCYKGDSYVKVNIFDSYPAWEPGMHKVECDLPFTVRWDERWM